MADGGQELRALLESVAELEFPKGSDYHYYKNVPAFKNKLKGCMQKLQGVIEDSKALARQPALLEEPDFEEEDEVYRHVSTILDDVYERVDGSLDAVRARQKQLQEEELQQAAAASGALLGTSAGFTSSVGQSAAQAVKLGRVVTHAVGLAKPQEAFQPQVDNSNTAWVPDAKLHPHLEGRVAAQAAGSTGSATAAAAAVHPYAAELEQMAYEPWQLVADEPQPPAELEATPFTFVDTPAALQQLVAALQSSRHVAIDLENHSFRSWQGFTCLMQVSTRSADYVVDTLALRSALGPALAQVFSDPSIVKVLHGADHDVLWLQRDFGLYLVNMFDTGQAARVLCLPSCSLAHLLEHYCGFKADKRYQLADWRVRPLGPDMLHYARCDTHYLLYIYDRLKQQLAAAPQEVPAGLAVPLPPGAPAGPLGMVLERSRQLCLSSYSKELLAEGSAAETLQRWKVPGLSPQQSAVFMELFSWRDRVCREEDESGGYVMPRASLVQLAQLMPRDLKELRRALGKAGSEVVFRRAAEVLAAVDAGKQAGAVAEAAAVQAQQAAADAAAAQPAVSKKVTFPDDDSLPQQQEQQREQQQQAQQQAAPARPTLTPKAIPSIATKSSAGALAGLLGSKAASLLAATLAPAQPAAAPAPAPAEGADLAVAALEALADDAPAGAPAASKPASKPAVQLKSKPASGMAAMVGGVKKAQQQPAAAAAAAAAVAAGVKPGGGLAGLLGKRPSAAEAAAGSSEAVKKLKASFSLPFNLTAQQGGSQQEEAAQAAAGAGSKQQGKQQDEQEQQEGEADGQPAGTTTAGDVRALVEQMKQQDAGTAAAVSSSPAAGGDSGGHKARKRKGQRQQQGGEAEDYIPLPLSEQYSMKRSKASKRQAGSGQGQRGPLSEEERRLQQALHVAGIQRQAADDQPDFPRNQKANKSNDDKGPEIQPFDYAAAKASKGKRGRGGQQQAFGEGAGYVSAGRGDRGRGGRGERGRGGRGGRDGGRRPVAGFNPYDIPDDMLIKGGKRSSTMVRSGNKSFTFK